jgi:hypothetical protein
MNGNEVTEEGEMKKYSVSLLVICLLFCLFPITAEAAAEEAKISLKDGNVLLPGSDIKFVSRVGGEFYTLVIKDGNPLIFESANRGKTWQKISATGLPKEAFVAMATSAPANIVLATKTKVFLSINGGDLFMDLVGPPGLRDAKDEITSISVTDGKAPQVLAGISHQQSEIARDGVYIFTGNTCEGQELRRANVISVAFNNFGLLAVTSSGSVTNLMFFDGEWRVVASWSFQVFDSKIVASEKYVYVIFNAKEATKSGVYRVSFAKWMEGLDSDIQNLNLPDDGIKILDSVFLENKILAVGTTVKEGDKDGTTVHVLSNSESKSSSWESFYSDGETSGCQVVVSDGVVFTGNSGKNSSFTRGKDWQLVSISLVDASGDELVFSSQISSEDKITFILIGRNNVFRVTDAETRRVFYNADGFISPKIEFLDDQKIFLFEIGQKKFWKIGDLGLSWRKINTPADITDSSVIFGEMWYSGKDGVVYRTDGSSRGSGLSWIKNIEPGFQGKILAIGGFLENERKQLSIISEGVLPTVLSLPFEADWNIYYSALDGYIYIEGNRQKYRILAENPVEWEKIVPTPTPLVPTNKTAAASGGSGGGGSIKPTPTPTTVKTTTPIKPTPSPSVKPTPAPTTRSPLPTVQNSPVSKNFDNYPLALRVLCWIGMLLCALGIPLYFLVKAIIAKSKKKKE